jgi:trimethylamine--corrinoid protein Co-methyltransferase
MTTTHTIRPKLTVLSPEQIEQIHHYSLEILANTGVRVMSERARALYEQALGPAAVDGEWVRIPPELVKQSIESAPSVLEIYDRQREPVFRLGDDRTRFGMGVTTLNYQDAITDEVTPFGRRHMEELVRLGNILDSFDAIATLGIVQDVPDELQDFYATLEMTANTSKPLIILVSEEDNFAGVLDMLEQLHGDLVARPFILPYFNPITPLIINQGTIDKMFVSIERGLPFIFSNYGMAGMTTPITPAGTAALLNAELLAGLTLSQVIKEGTPIVLGSLPVFFDMQAVVNYYDPLSYLLGLIIAEMMEHYKLPHCGSSGNGAGWGPDLPAADLLWMNHLTSVIGKVNLCPFVGGTLKSVVYSPATAVYANEVIRKAVRFAEGFVLSEETVGLDEIASFGTKGEFMRAGLTRRLFRELHFDSGVFPRFTLDKWRAAGLPRADDWLRRQTQQMLDELTAPADHEELLRRGEAFIDNLD